MAESLNPPSFPRLLGFFFQGFSLFHFNPFALSLLSIYAPRHQMWGREKRREEKRGGLPNISPQWQQRSLPFPPPPPPFSRLGQRREGKGKGGETASGFLKYGKLRLLPPLPSPLSYSRLPPSGLLWGLIYPFIFLLVGIFSRFMRERTVLYIFFFGVLNFAAHAHILRHSVMQDEFSTLNKGCGEKRLFNFSLPPSPHFCWQYSK